MRIGIKVYITVIHHGPFAVDAGTDKFIRVDCIFFENVIVEGLLIFSAFLQTNDIRFRLIYKILQTTELACGLLALKEVAAMANIICHEFKTVQLFFRPVQADSSLDGIESNC